jgi:hypothetical protein
MDARYPFGEGRAMVGWIFGAMALAVIMWLGVEGRYGGKK